MRSARSRFFATRIRDKKGFYLVPQTVWEEARVRRAMSERMKKKLVPRQRLGTSERCGIHPSPDKSPGMGGNY